MIHFIWHYKKEVYTFLSRKICKVAWEKVTETRFRNSWNQKFSANIKSVGNKTVVQMSAFQTVWHPMERAKYGFTNMKSNFNARHLLFVWLVSGLTWEEGGLANFRFLSDQGISGVSIVSDFFLTRGLVFDYHILTFVAKSV